MVGELDEEATSRSTKSEKGEDGSVTHTTTTVTTQKTKGNNMTLMVVIFSSAVSRKVLAHAMIEITVAGLSTVPH